MPFIEVKTNVALSEEKCAELKSQLGEAITLLPGKTEAWLMVQLSGDQYMYFSGNDRPCAIAEVKLFGSSSAPACASMTARVTDILSNALSIESSRIYVKYEEVSIWGWNGSNL